MREIITLAMGLLFKSASLLFVFCLLCDLASGNPLSSEMKDITAEAKHQATLPDDILIEDETNEMESNEAADDNKFINLGAHPVSNGACNHSNSDWMSTVPDDQLMSLMSIPGTHDSCSRYGGNMAKCQTMSLPDQLKSGIRFLDIRCRVINGVFAIHHGIVYQKIKFGDVLNQATDFLAAHPSESILMRVTQEYSKASSEEFIKIFKEYQKGRERWMYTENRIPTLGEARAKIVILADEKGLDGIPWDSINIQDDWNVPTIFDCGKKFNKVKAQLEKAVSQHNSGSKQLFIDFASGASTGAYPNAVANRVNPKVYNYLKGDKCAKVCYYGIVPMDFPGKYDKGINGLLIKQNKRKPGC